MSCCLALLSDAVVPDLVVRRSIAVDLYGQKLTYAKVDLVLCSDKAGKGFVVDTQSTYMSKFPSSISHI
jgi:hypothetical protein